MSDLSRGHDPGQAVEQTIHLHQCFFLFGRWPYTFAPLGHRARRKAGQPHHHRLRHLERGAVMLQETGVILRSPVTELECRERRVTVFDFFSSDWHGLHLCLHNNLHFCRCQGFHFPASFSKIAPSTTVSLSAVQTPGKMTTFTPCFTAAERTSSPLPPEAITARPIAWVKLSLPAASSLRQSSAPNSSSVTPSVRRMFASVRSSRRVRSASMATSRRGLFVSTP